MVVNVVSVSGQHFYSESGAVVTGVIIAQVSGQPVNVSGSPVWISGQHVYVESGVHVIADIDVTVSSGIFVDGISGQHMFVESGVYLASGLYVVMGGGSGTYGASGQYQASGVGVTVQSGVFVASGTGVTVQSGVGVLISGQHVYVESGVYLASGLYVASGVQVDSNTLASESAVTLLRRIAKLLEPSDVQDHMQRQQVRVDDFRYSGYAQPAFATLPIVGAVSGVSVVSVVTAVTTVGVSGICGNMPVLATSGSVFGIASWQPAWTGPVENRWFIADQARATYAAGIRKNIWIV